MAQALKARRDLLRNQRSVRKKTFVDPDDLDWSDGEDENGDNYKYLGKLVDLGQAKTVLVDTAENGEAENDSNNLSIEEEESMLISIDENASLIDNNRKPDHRRSGFNGYITVDKHLKDSSKEPIKIKRSKSLQPKKEIVAPPAPSISLPLVSSDAVMILGERLLQWLWYAFLRYGADESELVQVEHMPEVARIVCEAVDRELPFKSITILHKMENDDFIEYSDIVKNLAALVKEEDAVRVRGLQGDGTNSNNSNIVYRESVCYICCALNSCQHSRVDARDLTFKEQLSDDVLNESEMYRLNIVYLELKHQLNGIIRNKDLLRVMEQMNIPYDKLRLPKVFWDLKSEMLLPSAAELATLINTIRTDKDVIIDPMDAIYRYKLPQWLKEEFKPAEILLYEHHFTLIDQDGGGSIDAEELQALIINFGSSISLDEAQAMLDEYDMDGGGTIDFLEFMVLIYKIQRGTIDLSSSELATALVEAKSQLKIFEELEEVSNHPPEHCKVINFGGTPVTCELAISGPPSTPYAGFPLLLQMVLPDGYPYVQPDIRFHGRVPGLHILPSLSGDARLMHMKRLWSADWSINRVLVHIVDLLENPDPSLLPDNLYSIFESWEEQLALKSQEVSEAYQLEIQRLENARLARLAAAKLRAEQEAAAEAVERSNMSQEDRVAVREPADDESSVADGKSEEDLADDAIYAQLSRKKGKQSGKDSNLQVDDWHSRRLMTPEDQQAYLQSCVWSSDSADLTTPHEHLPAMQPGQSYEGKDSTVGSMDVIEQKYGDNKIKKAPKGSDHRLAKPTQPTQPATAETSSSFESRLPEAAVNNNSASVNATVLTANDCNRSGLSDVGGSSSSSSSGGVDTAAAVNGDDVPFTEDPDILKQRLFEMRCSLDSMHSLSTAETVQQINTLTRIELMHLRTMYLFLVRRDDEYAALIRRFMGDCIDNDTHYSEYAAHHAASEYFGQTAPNANHGIAVVAEREPAAIVNNNGDEEEANTANATGVISSTYNSSCLSAPA